MNSTYVVGSRERADPGRLRVVVAAVVAVVPVVVLVVVPVVVLVVVLVVAVYRVIDKNNK